MPTRQRIKFFFVCGVNIALGHVSMTRIWDENFRVRLVDRRKMGRGKNSGGKLKWMENVNISLQLA